MDTKIMSIAVETEVSVTRVRESIAVARSHGEKFFEQIVWQVENAAWSVLGYDSWDAMRDAEYGDMGVVAPRADRPELVARLRSRGLTQRQIGDTLGVTQKTVDRDLNSQMTNEDSPVPITNTRGQSRPANYTRTETTKVEETDMETQIAHAVPQKTSRKKKPPAPSKEVSMINDIRLYLGAIGSSPEIAHLSAVAKQCIIDAAYEMIHRLEGK